MFGIKYSVFDLDGGKSNSCSIPCTWQSGSHATFRTEFPEIFSIYVAILSVSKIQFCFRRAVTHFWFSLHHIWSTAQESPRLCCRILRTTVLTDMFLTPWWASARAGKMKLFTKQLRHRLNQFSLPQVCLASVSPWHAAGWATRSFVPSDSSSLTQPASEGQSVPLPGFRGYQFLQRLGDLPFCHLAWSHQSNKLLPDRH